MIRKRASVTLSIGYVIGDTSDILSNFKSRFNYAKAKILVSQNNSSSTKVVLNYVKAK